MIKKEFWIRCDDCKGNAKKSRGLSKKKRLQYELDCKAFEASKTLSSKPIRPKADLHICKTCSGTGLIASDHTPLPDREKFPHIAIIGGGIGGIALALACLHRNIPFTIFERDSAFNDRSQGYGLTLQQASKVMKELGINHLHDGVVSTKHIIHNSDGKILGEWGKRKWITSENEMLHHHSKHTNIHIARQSLRLELLNQLGENHIKWNHQLIDFKENTNGEIEMNFKVNETQKLIKTNLIVGADGIRSTVRKLVLGEERYPLQYLGCIVILGICPLDSLHLESPLLDGQTVFQTANGTERIYIMPYNKDSIMWQLSFPMSEENAKTLSKKGAQALKDEACHRIQWHHPIPEILAATDIKVISGYPVYDREMLDSSALENIDKVTLIGDAAHPMSPFKGQGANQALLDALLLARKISSACHSSIPWKTEGLRQCLLNDFEFEMINRSSIKVKASAAAAQFLHSDIVLQIGDETVGAKWSSSLDRKS